jgi:hypothetical protein
LALLRHFGAQLGEEATQWCANLGLLKMLHKLKCGRGARQVIVQICPQVFVRHTASTSLLVGSC